MSLKKTFLLALLLRLFIMPWFYHPDIKSQYFHFQFLSQGIGNIYQHITGNKSKLPYTDTFNYLPLTYFTFGSYYTLIKPFVPATLNSWLNDWGPNQNAYFDFPIFIFILKFPYLFFDLAIAFLLFKISSNRSVLNLWLFNPLTLYLIYVLGNFDVLPTALTLLSLYFFSKSDFNKSGFLLGLAVSLKMYPFLFLPFFLLRLFNQKKKAALYLLFFSLPILISFLPFLSSKDFIASFLGSGLTQKIIETKISNIPAFPLIYLFILFSTFKKTLAYSFSLVGLAFLSLVNLHPQWFIWFLPFFLLSFNSKTPKIFLSLIIILVLVYVSLINDQFLTWGHLIPIDIGFLSLTTPHDFIKFRFSQPPAILQQQIKTITGIFSSILLLISWRHDQNNS